jgi:hypothetical protein
MLAIAAREAQAATDVVPEFRIAAEANDNPRLREDDVPAELRASASRLVAEVRVGITKYTERSDGTFEAALRSDMYADAADDDLESNDLFLRGAGLWRGQRSRFGLSGDLAREKITGTEFLGAVDQDDVLDVDGVLLGFNETRTRASVSPYTEIDFGERSRVRLDLRAMDVSYDDESLLSARTDFTDWEAGAAYVRALTPRVDMSTRVFGGRYDADNGNITDTTGVELRFDREISDIWTLGGGFGVERSEFAYADPTTGAFLAGTDDNAIFDLAVHKETERSRIDFELSRRARPDSFGSVVNRRELAASLDRDFSSKVSGGIVFRAIRSDALDVIPDHREHGRTELRLQWAFRPLWSLVAGIQRAYWRNVNLDTSASSDSATIGFNYRGRSRRTQP